MPRLTTKEIFSPDDIVGIEVFKVIGEDLGTHRFKIDSNVEKVAEYIKGESEEWFVTTNVDNIDLDTVESRSEEIHIINGFTPLISTYELHEILLNYRRNGFKIVASRNVKFTLDIPNNKWVPTKCHMIDCETRCYFTD